MLIKIITKEYREIIIPEHQLISIVIREDKTCSVRYLWRDLLNECLNGDPATYEEVIEPKHVYAVGSSQERLIF